LRKFINITASLTYFDASDNLIQENGTIGLGVTGSAGTNQAGFSYQYGTIIINGTLEYNTSTSLYYWATKVTSDMLQAIVPNPFTSGGRSSEYNAPCQQDNYTFQSIELVPWSNSADFNRTSTGNPNAQGFQWSITWGDLVVSRHDS
jgi:hypothetical protein